jgi:hypothetical protein
MSGIMRNNNVQFQKRLGEENDSGLLKNYIIIFIDNGFFIRYNLLRIVTFRRYLRFHQIRPIYTNSNINIYTTLFFNYIPSQEHTMPELKSYKTQTPDPNTPEYHKLSLYLDALSSDQRLQIFRNIDQEPKDIKTLSSITKTSPENTTKHIDRMISVGLVKYGPTKKNSRGQPINTYVLVPGSFEAILRTLAHFSHIEFTLTPKIKQLRADLSNGTEISKMYTGPYLKMMGGDNDCSLYPLTVAKDHETIKLGRMDPEHLEKFNLELDIVVGNSFTFVTRVSQPHALISTHGRTFFIEDCDSKSGTYLNGQKLTKFQKKQLRDDDVIELGKEVTGARFLFKLPQREEQDTSG